jgi:hypothetical protein
MKKLPPILKTNHTSSAYTYKVAKTNQNRFSSLNPNETLLLSKEKAKPHATHDYPDKSYPSSGYTSLSTYSKELSHSSEEDDMAPVLQLRKVSQVYSSKAPSTPSRASNRPQIPNLQLGNFLSHQYPKLLTNNKNAQDSSETETSSSDEDFSDDYNDAENLFAIYP